MKNSVSILMPVKDTPLDWFRSAVASVMVQEAHFQELIIVDDCSQEHTLTRFLNDLEDIENILVIRNKRHKGIGRSLNIGLQQSNADLIIRMDSDDIARPNLVETQVENMSLHSNEMICGCAIEFFGDQSRIATHPEQVTIHRGRSGGCWLTNHPGICFRREWFMYDIGGYVDAGIGLPEDYPTWVNILRSGENIYNIPDVLVNYRSRPHQFHHMRRQWLEYWKQML